MIKFAYIAAGGAIGAVARYAAGGLALRWLGDGFAWGTLCVNLTGSLLIGVLAGLADVSVMPAWVRSFAMIGLLGAFTTFSTFSLETLDMLRDRQYLMVSANVTASCVGGIALVLSGFMGVRYMAAFMR